MALSLDFSRTAIATGSNIKVVAVLEIHIERKADAAMNPKTRRLLLCDPNALTMVRAMRLCAPLFAMAVDKINPPISSRTNGLP